MKALDGMTLEMKRELAEELGVKQVNLVNASRTRVESYVCYADETTSTDRDGTTTGSEKPCARCSDKLVG